MSRKNAANFTVPFDLVAGTIYNYLIGKRMGVGRVEFIKETGANKIGANIIGVSATKNGGKQAYFHKINELMAVSKELQGPSADQSPIVIEAEATPTEGVTPTEGTADEGKPGTAPAESTETVIETVVESTETVVETAESTETVIESTETVVETVVETAEVDAEGTETVNLTVVEGTAEQAETTSTEVEQVAAAA